MLRAVDFLCIVVVFSLYLTIIVSSSRDSSRIYRKGVMPSSAEPLKLSPYIENKQIKLGRMLARVNLEGAEDIESYSGYLTVDKESQTNLFFWYFPSRNDVDNDPVILWMQGGLGNSIMLGIFVEHGPFLKKPGEKLAKREFSWINNHSVLYIDNPSAGFSFGNGRVSQSVDTIAGDFCNAVYQFLTLFPNLQDNYFYIAGQSEAANIITSLAYKIMTNNEEFEVNLKGIAIGNAVINPLRQFKFGSYLYQLGIINNYEFKELQRIEEEISTCVANKDNATASKYWNRLRFEYLECTKGKINQINYVDEKHTLQFHMGSYSAYINSIRKNIHVGKTPFRNSYGVFKYGLELAHGEEKIGRLLTKYRILFYTGHLDTTVNPARVSEILSSVVNFEQVRKNQWYVDRKIAGYVKIAGKLTVLTVLNAGGLVPFDQPKRALNMITRFTRNQRID